LTRIGRYWSLWRTLSPDERRARSGRVVERWLRRSAAVRRLGLAPDAPRWRHFQAALSVPLDSMPDRWRKSDPTRGPLFGSLADRAASVAARHPTAADALIARARDILDGRIEVLGPSVLQTERPEALPDWHTDWHSGVRWPAADHFSEQVVVRGDGSDVKYPWELSRSHHVLVVAQAWWLAPARLPEQEARDLRPRLARTVRTHVDDWIVANPRGLGVNWSCAMEVAIRASTWLAAVAMLRDAPELDDGFLLRFTRSIWVHGLHIRRNLEVFSDRPPTNHYIADLVGLLAIGCALPELHDSAAWRRHAVDELVGQIGIQIGDDGVDYEGSVAYHRLVTEMLCHATMLIRATGRPVPDALSSALGEMLDFVAAYVRPDGSAPRQGDDDDGRFLPLDGIALGARNDHRHVLALGGAVLERGDLLASAGGADAEAIWFLGAERPAAVAPTTRSRPFPNGGFYTMGTATWHASITCGPVGTRGLGSHGHNDVMSLCLWADGVEWITDPGTGSYTGDPDLRNRLRRTAAHATLQLGDREQNVPGDGVDGLFRLDESAHPQVASWSAQGDGAELEAAHVGFSGPDGQWRHERTFRSDFPTRTLDVLDSLHHVATDPAAPLDETVFVRWPLGQGVDADPLPAEAPLPDGLPTPGPGETRMAFRLRRDGKDGPWLVVIAPEALKASVVDGELSPRYGVVFPSKVVQVELTAAHALRLRTQLRSGPEPTGR
jgi:hypothetical protein